MKYLLVVLSLMLSVGCTKVTEKVSQTMKSDYQKTQEVAADRFKQEVTQSGDCWADEYQISDQASFIKNTVVKTEAYLLLSKENGLVLFAQPVPDCQETQETSAKCAYWIRTEKESDMNIFYKEYSKRVACPAGVTVAEIVKRASPSDRERYDFSQVVKQ